MTENQEEKIVYPVLYVSKEMKERLEKKSREHLAIAKFDQKHSAEKIYFYNWLIGSVMVFGAVLLIVGSSLLAVQTAGIFLFPSLVIVGAYMLYLPPLIFRNFGNDETILKRVVVSQEAQIHELTKNLGIDDKALEKFNAQHEVNLTEEQYQQLVSNILLMEHKLLSRLNVTLDKENEDLLVKDSIAKFLTEQPKADIQEFIQDASTVNFAQQLKIFDKYFSKIAFRELSEYRTMEKIVDEVIPEESYPAQKKVNLNQFVKQVIMKQGDNSEVMQKLITAYSEKTKTKNPYDYSANLVSQQEISNLSLLEDKMLKLHMEIENGHVERIARQEKWKGHENILKNI